MLYVSKDALRQRINRKLSPLGLRLIRPRGRLVFELGPYYVRSDDNCIVERRVELEDKARELNVLHGPEVLESSDA